MNILSIDWDYFFPDSMPYDWGHNEEKAFYLEMIWNFRLNNRNIITGAEAFTEYVPTIPKGFWEIVTNEPLVFIAESHASIQALPFKSATLTNLDAHHDAGYGDSDKKLDCGNWVFKLNDRIKEYHLVYPKWRLMEPEPESIRVPDSIITDLPEPKAYDMVFICRSGCWTPTWFDPKFRSWIKKSGFFTQFIDNYVSKNRKPNMSQAIKAKQEDSILAMMKG